MPGIIRERIEKEGKIGRKDRRLEWSAHYSFFLLAFIFSCVLRKEGREGRKVGGMWWVGRQVAGRKGICTLVFLLYLPLFCLVVSCHCFISPFIYLFIDQLYHPVLTIKSKLVIPLAESICFFLYFVV